MLLPLSVCLSGGDSVCVCVFFTITITTVAWAWALGLLLLLLLFLYRLLLSCPLIDCDLQQQSPFSI